jgi:hypothetical protein
MNENGKDKDYEYNIVLVIKEEIAIPNTKMAEEKTLQLEVIKRFIIKILKIIGGNVVNAKRRKKITIYK